MEYNLNKVKSLAGNLKIESFTIIERPSFMEYLRSGWAINLSIAIDFTASNGEIFEKDSLHWQDPTGNILNQYEQALLGVGKVMEPYALNSQFATFGFGGIPKYLGSTQPNHCFNLNGKPNPTIDGLTNVFQAYKYAIKNTSLAGPTYFSHVLKALLSYVQ